MGYDYDEEWDGEEFAQPGSALRVATETNPRNLPCPTCNHPNRLTPKDKALGYQCDSCADAMERGWDIDYYEEPPKVSYSDFINVYNAWTRGDKTQRLGQWLMNALLPEQVDSEIFYKKDHTEAAALFTLRYVEN